MFLCVGYTIIIIIIYERSMVRIFVQIAHKKVQNQSKYRFDRLKVWADWDESRSFIVKNGKFFCLIRLVISECVKLYLLIKLLLFIMGNVQVSMFSDCLLDQIFSLFSFIRLHITCKRMHSNSSLIVSKYIFQCFEYKRIKYTPIYKTTFF